MTRMSPLQQLGHNGFYRLAILSLSLSIGCAAFNVNKNSMPEYDEARNSVEGYSDSDGNWVRPEGARAEKKKKGKTPAALAWIPGMSEKPPNKEKARALYLEGDELFEKAKNAEGDERIEFFRQAAKKYKAAAKEWRSSALEQDAMMMAGESYFFSEDYTYAENLYVKLVKEYPRTRYQDKVDQRLMEISLYWLKYDEADPKAFYELNVTDRRRPWNDTHGHGKRVLDRVRLANPTGKLADDATMELATDAFRKGNYVEARDTFEDLRITYPDSPHQFDAHFLGLKAALETYEGAQYASEPLDEAEKMIKKIMKQFPQQAKEHQEYLNRAYLEVRFKKSERLWDQADYHLKRGENNAARMYLDRLLTEYNDTPFAENARTAQEKIAEQPGEPTRHFQWLANAFPERKKTAPLLESKEDVGK